MNIQQFLDKLELLRVRGRQEPTLTEEQKSELKKHPKSERAELKKQYLDHAKKEIENWIFGTLQELEADIKASDLPPEAINALLDAISDVKDAQFVASPQVLDKIEDLRQEVTQQQEEQQKQQQKQNDFSIAPIVTTVAVTAALGLTIFEEKNKKYYEEKFMDQLLQGTPSSELTNLPVEELGFARKLPERPARGVGRKQKWAAWKLWRSMAHKEGEQPPPPPVASANAYSNLHYDTLQNQAQELNDYLVKDAQAKQQAAGKPAVNPTVILANLAAAHPAQQRLAQKAVYQAHPELKEKHQAQTLEVDSTELLKRIIRQERSVRQAKAKILEKKLKHWMQAHKETLQQDPSSKAPHLIALQTELNNHRQTLAHLGIVMDNFEQVLTKNHKTAADLMKDRTQIMPQLMALNVAGFTPRSQLRKRLGTLEREQPISAQRATSLTIAQIKRTRSREIA